MSSPTPAQTIRTTDRTARGGAEARSAPKQQGPGLRVFARLGEFIKPDRAQVVLVLLMTIVGGIASAIGPALVAQAINGPIVRGNTTGLMFVLIQIGVIYILSFVMQMIQLYLLGALAQRVLQRLRVAIMLKLSKLDIAQFDQQSSGDFIARLTNDLNRLAALFGQSLMQTLGSSAVLIVVLVTMLALDWRLALASFVVLPLIFWVTLYLSRRTFTAAGQSRVTSSNLTEAAREELTNIRVSQVFNRAATNQEHFQRIGGAYRDALVREARWTDASTPVNSVLSALSLAIVIGFGSYLTLNGLSTVGTVIAFILYVQQFNWPLQSTANLYNQLQGTVASAQRIWEILDTPVTVRDAPNATDLGSLTGEVVFENVTFGYKQGQPVIRDVNLTIPAGQTVAVVGATGAGKSTLVNLVTRFYDVWSGRVLVDGHDVRSVTQASLRSEMAVILQESQLFAGTIASNIRYGQLTATQDEIIEAAKAANAHDFIMALPQGYDTPLGGRGITLSNGQAQLLVFARALVRNPKILILDEATSTLDVETERIVHEALERVLANRTSLVIAHRLSTIRNADRIVVMDQGQVAEQGTHDELMAQGGRYAALVAHQGAGSLRVGVEAERLAAIPLFAHLGEETRRTLAAALHLERHGAGEDIVEQGAFGGTFYVINSGQVEVLVDNKGTEQVLSTLSAGDYFGEIALVEKEARTATVRTTQATELYSLDQADFAALLEREAGLRQAMADIILHREDELTAPRGAGRNGAVAGT